MSAPEFAQSTGSPRLYWLDGAAWNPGGAFGLVLFADTPEAPSTLNLAQSFTDFPGAYVCLAIKPAAAAETAFVDAVLAQLARLGPEARFLWFEQPTPDSQWGRRVLYVQQASGAAQGLIDRPTVFPVGAYRFSVSGGQVIAPTADGFAISGDVVPPFQLVTDAKAWPLTPSGDGATVLSLAGATAGVFNLGLTLEASANPGGISDYELLDVGFRYGLPDPSDPNGVLLTSLRYPLFRGLAPAPVAMSAQIDPAGVLEPTRTRLTYAGQAAAQDTHYTTQLGYGVSLAPNGVAPSGLPAGLAFHRCPRSDSETLQDDPYYLAPIGAFAMTVGAPDGAGDDPAARLTAGLSGNEYFGFSAGAGVPVIFTPGQKAFAPDFPPPGLNAEGGGAPASATGSLTDRATTAYAALGAPDGGSAWYFAQPDDAAFFHIGAGSDPTALSYLPFLELVTSDVTTPATPYPLVPYAGASDNNLALAQALEMQILSPLRRGALDGVGSQLKLKAWPATLEDGSTQGVTPQGVLASFTGETWNAITFSPAPAGQLLPQLAINTPSANLRGAFQSNQLFLVAADGELLMQNCDFNYWITESVLGDLTRLSGEEAVPSSVISLLAEDARAPAASLAEFTAMLDEVLTGEKAQYRAVVTKYSVYFQLDVEGWRFRLSPSLWADQTAHRPVLIFKYAAGPLYDFVQDTDSWAWPDVAMIGGSLTTTQTLINDIITAAVDEVAALGAESDLFNFVTEVVSNPSWTGLVMLNANVPFSSVPPELSGLAAGVKPDEFRAHHVGISVTPIAIDTAAKRLDQGPSAIFGLIDYEDLEDIAHIEGAFDFKVLLLRVLFVNSAIANFAGRIELFINRLFGEQVTLYFSEHYNNLLLDGAYQRHDGSGHYVFRSSAVCLYGSSTADTGGSGGQVVLTQTEFDQAQFLTATADTATQPTSRNRFLLQGKLRFSALNGFDAFSFGPTRTADGTVVADGYLVFSGASVDMEFPVDAPDQKTFNFNLDEISFDPAASQARSTSFFQRFPLQVAGLIRGSAGQKPSDLGFLALETPLSQPAFTGEWFGLTLAVDLGTLGALSSSSALSAAILAAWSPTPHGHDVNIGLSLPGLQSARSLSPIEGVIDLGFQSIDLQAQGASSNPPDPAYTLRFRNFYLRFLGWKFPPGQNVITLFGDPDVASQSIGSDRGALGWYAAYAKKD